MPEEAILYGGENNVRVPRSRRRTHPPATGHAGRAHGGPGNGHGPGRGHRRPQAGRHPLAEQENLTVERRATGAGLLESIDELYLDPAARKRLSPEIADFYQHTADYDLEVWSAWSPLFRPFGGLIHTLYSRRLQQLNLPLRPLDTARGISSEVLKLRDRDSNPRYTIWYRTLKSTGQVIYSGVYTTCTTPRGQTCVKVIFPLPRGNATVVMSAAVGDRGELILTSSGRAFGDPGFYFLLRNQHHNHWAQYIRSFRESITVFVDNEQTLRADHALTLWRRPVLRLHYKMLPARTNTPAAPATA